MVARCKVGHSTLRCAALCCAAAGCRFAGVAVGGSPSSAHSLPTCCFGALAYLQVCGSLTQQLWRGLTHWVDQKRLVPNRKHIAAYAAELCQYEVRPVE